jgi:CheY-like chemotaxis protein
MSLKYRPPQVGNLTALVADDNPASAKLVRDLCRECGIQRMITVGSAPEFIMAATWSAVDIYVVEQKILEDFDTPAWHVVDKRVGADGVAPFLMLFSLPRARDVQKAQRHGIRVGLRKPFSPKDFWLRLQWLTARSAPSPRLKAAEKATNAAVMSI